ncbi:MAG TPA: AMIN domain-containing protein, partial [Thermoanaerobaculia bacterium]|nr:AMIN domain-containing protein [Thermoanaerobaculia bacterium]
MMKTLRLLVMGSVLVLAVACASGNPSEVQAGSAVPSAENGGRSTLDALRAETLPAPRLVLQTTGAPAYTSYSPQPDVFVLDLPRTTKAYGLVLPTNLPSYVASVAADEAIELGRPLTRVTVRFTSPMSATASTVDGSVVIDFSEPLMASVEDFDAPEVLPPPEDVVSVSDILETPVVATAAPASSDFRSDYPPARRLRNVSSSGSEVVLETDGRVEYTTFRLANPLRLVVDLKGVTNHVREKNFQVAAASVRQIRVSQFQLTPEAITRIVVDLDELIEYDIVRDGRSLRVTFGRARSVPPAALAQSSEPVAREAYSDPAPPSMTAEAEEMPPPAPPVPVREPTRVASEAPPPAPARSLPAELEPVVAEPVVVEPVVTMASTQDERNIFEEEAPSVAFVVPPPPARVEPEFRPVTTHVVNSPAPQSGPRSTATATLPESTARVSPVEDVFIEPPITRVGPMIDLSGGIAPGTSRTLSTEERVYTGEPLSLTLKDADIKDVLRTFAQLTGLNIAIDP